MSRADPADPAILSWPGPVAEGIARLEARLAAGARFGVMVTATGWEMHDTLMLAQWHRAASARMEPLCVGWATVRPGAAVRPALLREAVPGAPAGLATRICADRCAALAWLRMRLRTAKPL